MTVLLLAPEVVTVSLLDPEVAVVSLLVPEQTREVELGPLLLKPLFPPFPDPPELEWRGRGLVARPRRGDGLVARPRRGDGLVARPQIGDGLVARPRSGGDLQPDAGRRKPENPGTRVGISTHRLFRSHPPTPIFKIQAAL